MTFYGGVVGPCWWTFYGGFVDEETTEGFIQHLTRLTDEMTSGRLLLDLRHDMSMPSAKQRKRVTDLIRGAKGLERIAGHAFVANSTIARGVLTAANWVRPPVYPEKVCATPDEAIKWLEARSSLFVGAAFKRAIEAKVPGYAALKW